MPTRSLPLSTVVIATRPSEQESEISTKLVLILLLGHLAWGVLVEVSTAFDYLHMWLTLILGFGSVIYWKNRPELAAYVAAYFVASEVLWRIQLISVFWEIGKYASAAVMLIAFVRMKGRKMHMPSTSYFLLLLPGASVAFWVLGLEVARQRVSFALSGPFLLMVGVGYFSNIRLSSTQMRRLFLTLACGGMATGGATGYAMLTAAHLHFSNNSSMESSAGFGPNQVSAVLGMGALSMVMFVIQGAKGWIQKLATLLAAVLMATLSALTFSRGGLVDGAIAFLLASVILLTEPQYRARLVPALIAGVVAALVVLPKLEDLTGGALGARFENTSTTHRSELIGAELEVWSENPIFGVGVSLASEARKKASHSSKVAHTEFSRMLGEHGAFGLAAGVLLFAMPLMHWRSVQGAFPKALIVLCCTWTFAYMASNAMRLAAPSFFYGLAFVNLLPANSMFVLKAGGDRSIGSYRT